jgi:hypothetical protein
MNAPYADVTSCNATYLLIMWDSITLDVDTGGDPVIYYKIEWDNATNGATWTILNTSPSTMIN